MKHSCYLTKVYDGEFKKSTLGSTYFHCNFVYMYKCWTVCVERHKICLKMLKLILGDSRGKQEVVVSHKISWKCNNIQISNVFLNFHSNIYTEFQHEYEDFPCSIKPLRTTLEIVSANMHYICSLCLTFDALFTIFHMSEHYMKVKSYAKHTAQL